MNEMQREIARNAELDDIQDGFLKEIALKIGIENLCEVFDVVQGDTVYLPNLSNFLYRTRQKMIQRECNGYNMKEIAKKYDVSVRYIRELLLNKGAEK